MEKKPKFRWVRLAISNDAFAKLEEMSKFAKVSRSQVITELLRKAQRKMQPGQTDFKRGERIEPRKKSAMLLSLQTKLDDFCYQKILYEKLRDALADMPDDEADIYVRKQNLARLKGLDANIEMAQCLIEEEIENLEF